MLPVKGIKMMIISVLLASVLMPFSVQAETINNHVIGTNVYTVPISEEQINTQGIYNCTAETHLIFELDGEYLGWSNLGIQVKYYNYYYGAQNPSWSQNSKTWSGNYYINGNSFEVVIPFSWYSNNPGYYQNSNPLPSSTSDVVISFTNTGNVVSYGELSTLNDILSVLNDVYSHIDDIENKMDLENDILNKIYNTKQWHIPIESFTAVYQLLNYMDSIYTNTVNYFDYPVFKLKTDNKLFVLWTNLNEDNYYIFGTDYNIYDNTSLNNLLKTSDSNVTLTYDYSYQLSVGTDYFRIIRIKIRKNSGSGGNTTVSMKIDGYPSGTKIMPIYLAKASNQNISTDFALVWNLNNRLLNYLQTIANGTNQSNQSASDLQGNTSDFETAADQYYTIENTYNNNMNTQLQNIDTSTGLSGFGGNFLTSANWVRVQYQNLTNGNPFGSLVTYGLTLGLALLLLGKVFL